MRKTTFFGNLVAWAAVVAACVAFLAWYHGADAAVVEAAMAGSTLVQLGMVLASPALLYALGAVLGLLLVRFQGILMGRASRLACRFVAIAALVALALVAVPVLAPATGNAFLGISVVVVYVTMTAPVLLMMLGFAYALGCAGVDPSKRGPFAKYLPDDDEDGRAA